MIGGTPNVDMRRHAALVVRWAHRVFMANDSLYAAEWRPGTEHPVGAVRALFRLGSLSRSLSRSYDVMPGDSAFVMLAPNEAERTRVVVIANFVEQLRLRSSGLRSSRQ